MTADIDVYDLGEVQPGDSSAKPPPRSGTRRDRPTAPPARAPSRRNGLAERAGRAGPRLAASLSLFLPGSGQVLAGEPVCGLFFVSGIGFALAALHGLVTTLDRLLPTLDLLELPRAAAGATLGALLLALAALHVAAVVHAHSLNAHGHHAPLPLVAALASALVPGWGQILVGHRVRAAFFLGGLWLIAVAWLAATPAGLRIVQDLGLDVPRGARDGWGPIALVAAPIVVWALAAYDAAMGAAAERRVA